MPTATVENYLKQAYMLQQTRGGGLVPMGVLATAMSVTPGTATSMVKALAEADLLDYEPREGIRLTAHGNRVALAVLRRHRLIELFLVEALELDWSEVHAEAEVLEHAVSDKVLACIDRMLGHPDTDPHGDPIPPDDATAPPARPDLASLLECPLKRTVTVTRILDQDRNFLRFADRHGLTPGAVLAVKDRNASADAVTVEPEESAPVTLGSSAAAKILVRLGD